MAPADVRNAFHQMRISAWLFSFFGLPFVHVSEIELQASGSRRSALSPRLIPWVFLGDVSLPGRHGRVHRVGCGR